MLTLDQVSVRRGGREVLHRLSLSLVPGTITAIVGPSGVGKSTLLNTLNGLIVPASGAIRVAGLGNLAQAGVLQAYRRRTATIFQEHALIERLSALDNVLLGLADRRHPLSLLPWPRPMRYQAAEALDRVGLLARANQPVAHLSGGERQRVGMARALVRQPQLLLGDEPFSAVDPALVRYLSGSFREGAQRQGLTLVLVLHQLDVARAMAHRIIGLQAGEVAFDGPPQAFDATAQARIFPDHPAPDPSGFLSVSPSPFEELCHA